MAEAAVISAGLGFAPFSELAPSYDITFTSGSVNTHPGEQTPEGRREWWRAIGGPDALSAFLVRSKCRQVIAAMSSGYLDAIVEPLAAISAHLGTGSVLVFCTRPSAFALRTAGHFVVRVDPRKTRHLGGTVANSSLIALKHALEVLPSGTALSQAAFEEVFAALPMAVEVYPRREKHGKEHAETWLRSALSGWRPPASASAALRAYRDAGFAFEQKAFHRLFAEIAGQSTSGLFPAVAE